MTDALLERLTYEPAAVSLETIPWPSGLAPKVVAYGAVDETPLPAADVLVVTWTAAEWQALADVLTPGHPKASWLRYAENWASYEDQLTWKSPAKEAGCMGEYALTEISGKRVLCFHSQLHLATDAVSAPIVQLWSQIVGEVKPSLVITTGTAGGIGESTELGDVFVVSDAKFNCTKGFRSKPWAQERFDGSLPVVAGPHAILFSPLTAPNAAKLHPVSTRNPELTFGGDVETVDYFGFADTDDSYGIVKDDPLAHTEEMDDATLPLALSAISNPPRWLSIRNASDPQVPSSIGDLDAQAKWASEIYTKYGYYTTVGSAIACALVIADL